MAVVVRGVLKGFDAGAYTATVLTLGATRENVTGIPVNRGIAASVMVASRQVAVVVFDETNPRDGVVVAVYE